ncbi:MAG TPA: hypothetical protein DEP51_04810 [Clostridiales bacterium]|nr:hypothetical protein [Clostridiales bacterium]
MLTGNNGILQRATDAKTLTGIEQEKEIVALAYNSAFAKKISNGDSTSVTAGDLELTNQGASADGNDTIVVTFASSNRKYEIQINGNITLIEDGTLTDLQKLQNFFAGKNYTFWWDDDNGSYKMLDGLPISYINDEDDFHILYNNNTYELIYANNDINDIVENVVEYKTPSYADNWIIAWAYNGSYWSNPYTRENGLLDSFFENIDSNYSISNTSDLDDANVLALLYENENNTSTYKLVMYGTGTIVGDENGNGQVPWRSFYHRQFSNELSCDSNFESAFCNNIRLEIQEGITGIGDNAFSYSLISYAYISNSVQVIRYRFF